MNAIITLEPGTVLQLPFGITVPDIVIVPDYIPLLQGRVLPEAIVVEDVVTIPELEFDEENISNYHFGPQPKGILDAVSVRIFPQVIGYGDQYVQFDLPAAPACATADRCFAQAGMNCNINHSLLVGHCNLPTNTLPHGPVEEWKFLKPDVETNTVKMLIPKALYHEFIFPYYLVSFWQGLSVHLEYLDPKNWWATYPYPHKLDRKGWKN